MFAWLLRADGTHELGDAFQRLCVEHVNRGLPAGPQLPTSGYRVVQEVDTSGHDPLAPGRDIADIVLTSAHASVVVENFGTSDGHGHDYHGYLALGTEGGTKQSVVVLLCARRESDRQTDGLEQAVVVTYAELPEGLKTPCAAVNATVGVEAEPVDRGNMDHVVHLPVRCARESVSLLHTGRRRRRTRRPRWFVSAWMGASTSAPAGRRKNGPPVRSAAQYLGEEEAIRGFRMNSPSSIPVTATIPESKNG